MPTLSARCASRSRSARGVGPRRVERFRMASYGAPAGAVSLPIARRSPARWVRRLERCLRSRVLVARPAGGVGRGVRVAAALDVASGLGAVGAPRPPRTRRAKAPAARTPTYCCCAAASSASWPSGSCSCEQATNGARQGPARRHERPEHRPRMEHGPHRLHAALCLLYYHGGGGGVDFNDASRAVLPRLRLPRPDHRDDIPGLRHGAADRSSAASRCATRCSRTCSAH